MRKRFGSGVCAVGPGFGIARVLLAFTFAFGLVGRTLAQMETATLSGTVTDPTGAVVAGAEVHAVRIDTGTSYVSTTNTSGRYLIVGLQPGHFRIFVTKQGFKQIELTDVTLNVQDTVSRNFSLEVGAASETVTVRADDLHINTSDGTVSTVVDRQFAENLPLNGRSFQTLIELTPGVVLTVSNQFDSGQFSVNGQRASSNYWTVDGVSANFGVSPLNSAGGGLAGSLGSFSAQGGTNSLVSVDALQEFRIQTSTYAPEFGRTPGGQISIVTRSGANQFHGTAFEYLRNDVLDANDWFADSRGLRKPPERQSDFGGTFSGPIFKNRTFFFFSYEGLRLRLPQVALTTVPCDSSCTAFGNARTMAASAIQPYVKSYPVPNGPEIFTPCTPNVNGCPGSGERPTGAAEFNASFSNRSTLDATSLRVDHRINDRLSLFGRYNYSPSELVRRGAGGTLNRVSPAEVTTQTGTLGATWAISPGISNDARFNYSRADADSSVFLDNFGGAATLPSFPFPSPFTSRNSAFTFQISSLIQGILGAGPITHHLQQQFNIVDSLAVQKGSHSLKFGVDFRRLSPLQDPQAYNQFALFPSVSSAAAGNLTFSFIQNNVGATFLFRNLGVFVQDTWRMRRLSLTYGVRWDVDFAPSSTSGPSFPAVTGFNLTNFSNLALGPAGTSPFNTPYGSVAPRVGIAYQLSQSQDWQTVLRGGFGVFYDLASGELGNNLFVGYPFGGFNFTFGGTFPLSPAAAAPGPIAPPNATNFGTLVAFDPHLELPYTLEWNVALEQSLGKQQTLSASYVGAAGRRLIQSEAVLKPNSNLAAADLIGNLATSDYDALQIEFQRRLSRGLQALTSFTLSHSIDSASAGSFGNLANGPVPALGSFDIRNAFSAGVTYDVPAPKMNAFARAILRGWSLQSVIQVPSAPPVNVFTSKFRSLIDTTGTEVRPDLVAGMPLYLLGPQFPGGKAFNPAGFTNPPTSGGTPLRQGNLGRNALRGFGATQWDFGIHRDFPIRESLHLQFRAEMFNVLNHPNFGQPAGDLNTPQFGRSTQMLGASLTGGIAGGGAFDPLYQIGGPRSIQFALKVQF